MSLCRILCYNDTLCFQTLRESYGEERGDEWQACGMYTDPYHIFLDSQWYWILVDFISRNINIFKTTIIQRLIILRCGPWVYAIQTKTTFKVFFQRLLVSFPWEYCGIHNNNTRLCVVIAVESCFETIINCYNNVCLLTAIER